MKKIVCLFAAAAALLACSKDELRENPETSKVTLKMNVLPLGTKAYVTEGADLALDKVQVMVFNGAGALEASTDLVTAGSSLQLDIEPGQKTICAVGNVPSKCTPGSLSELYAQEYSLSSNSPSKLIMSAFESMMVKQSGTINLSLERLACKIVLDEIMRSFSEAAYDELPLTIKRIYLSNVAAVADLSASGGVPGSFVVEKGVIGNLSAAYKALLVDEGLNQVLYDNDSYNVVHTFYAYPNGVTDDEFGGDSFHARRTRLVVECEYNGAVCYYPITLPGLEPGNYRGTLERNKVYHITNLTLTRPGAPDPDVPTGEVSSIQTCTFSISAEPWSTGHTYTETFS